MPEYAKGFVFTFISSVTASVSFRSLVGGTIGTVLWGSRSQFQPTYVFVLQTVFDSFFDDFLRLSWTTFATKNWTISTSKLSVQKLLQDIDETRCQCLKELSQRKEFTSWVQEALRGTVCHCGGQKAEII